MVLEAAMVGLRYMGGVVAAGVEAEAEAATATATAAGNGGILKLTAPTQTWQRADVGREVGRVVLVVVYSREWKHRVGWVGGCTLV